MSRVRANSTGNVVGVSLEGTGLGAAVGGEVSSLRRLAAGGSREREERNIGIREDKEGGVGAISP